MKIFITGISSGIGKELAKKLILEGHEVWGIARRETLLETLSLDINNDNFHYDRCDTTNFNEVKIIYNKMLEMQFIPEVIFLNAAIDREDEYPRISETSIETIRTNLEAPLFWVHLFIKEFIRRGSGQFIAVSSLYANWSDKSSVAYSASKAGLSMLFRGLRLRYGKTKIFFKLIYLGPVATSINPRFENNNSNRKSFFVASASDTARYLNKCIFGRNVDYFYPRYICIIFFFLRWLPDSVFELLISKFKR
jgi:short-subunit dehydrogenase